MSSVWDEIEGTNNDIVQQTTIFSKIKEMLPVQWQSSAIFLCEVEIQLQ